MVLAEVWRVGRNGGSGGEGHTDRSAEKPRGINPIVQWGRASEDETVTRKQLNNLPLSQWCTGKPALSRGRSKSQDVEPLLMIVM